VAQLGALQVKVEPDLAGFASQVSASMARIGAGLGRTVAGVGRDLASAAAAITGAGSIAVAGLAAIGFKTSASLETAELQFQTLLGSADEARAKVAELFQFAAKTPFEAGPIIEASRQLQIFGGDALNTEQNLRRIGDAAAAVGQPIEQVAFWVGRANEAIQSGRPFGEAALRLQEMGVITGDTRNRMEELSAQGASADQIFAVLGGRLDEFGGAMARQQDSWLGLTSTMKDLVSLGAANIFAPLFDSTKRFLVVLRDLADTPVFVNLQAGFASLVGIGAGALDRLTQGIQEFAASLDVTDVASAFAGVHEAIGDVGDALEGLGPIVAGVGAGFAGMALSAVPGLGLLTRGLTPLTGGLAGLVVSSDEARGALGNLASVLGGALRDILPEIGPSLARVADAIGSSLAGAIDALTPALGLVVRELLPTFADVLADVVPPVGRIVEALAQLAGSVIETLGPSLASVAAAAGALAGGALDVVADILGVLARNADVAVPALVGLGAAFAAVKVAGFIRDMGGIVGIFTSVRDAAIGFGRSVQANLAGAFSGIAKGAGDASAAVGTGAGGLAGALGGLGVGLLVAGGVALLTRHFQKQAEDARLAAEQVRTLADMYRQYGNTVTTTADFIIESRRGEHQGLEDLTDRLADVFDSEQQIAQLVHDGAEGRKEAVAEIRRQAEATVELDENQRRVIESTYGAQAADIIARQEKQLVDAEVRKLSGDYDKLAETTGNAAGEAETLATSEDRQRQATETLRASISGLKAEFDRLYGSQLSVAEGDVRIAEGNARVAETLAASTGSLALNTEEGRRSAGAIQGQVAAIFDQIDALAASGKTQEHVAAQGSALFDNLVATMGQFGITGDAARAYLETLGLTPESIQTRVEAAGLEGTQARTQELQDRLRALGDTTATPQIQALIERGQFDEADRRLRALEVVREARIDAKTFGVDESEKALQRAARQRDANIDARTRNVPASERALTNVSRRRDAYLDAKARQVAQADSAFNRTARRRDAPIDAQARNTAAASGALDNTARRRSAAIDAEAHTSAAERAINNAARPRRTVITVVQDILFPGGRSGGGGSGRALRPAATDGLMAFGQSTPGAAYLGRLANRPLPVTNIPAGQEGEGTRIGVNVQEAIFNDPVDLDVVINRVNLALAAGRL